jgi:hypothetical protein
LKVNSEVWEILRLNIKLLKAESFIGQIESVRYIQKS